METIPKLIGAPVQRREDPLLVRGLGTYIEDIRLPRMLDLVVARSPFPYATLNSVDSSAAEEMPGVRLILLPSDVANVEMPPRPVGDAPVPRRYPLVQDRVLAPGEPVAAVVGTSAALARDAADLIFADLDPEEIVGGPVSAADAPALHSNLESNVLFVRSGGDRKAFEAIEGDLRISGRVTHQRVIPAPMETRGIIADWRANRLDVHLSSQAPHLMADEIAASFGLSVSSIRVNTPYVGGAFGCKFDLAEEEFLAIVASQRLGAPVRWIETRREHMLAIGHGRAQIHEFEVIADARGKINGLWVDSTLDLGARGRYIEPGTPTPRIGTGSYDIPVYGWNQRGVLTNRAPRGIYRGAGRPEATLTIERIMDQLAAEAGVDPVEIRHRNFVQPDQFPYRSGGGYLYDSGDYDKALDRLCEFADYEALRTDQARLRQRDRVVGIGIAAYVEICAFEAWEAGVCRVHPDGSVTVSSGTLDQGQGHRTTYAQLAADQLGLPIEMITVVQGDTASAPWGSGTSGSRSVSQGGSAIFLAAGEVAIKARTLAAQLMEAAPQDIDLAGGRAHVRGTDVSVPWIDIVEAAYRGRRLPSGITPGLEAEGTYESFGKRNFPFGAALATVEIDRDTGSVRVTAYWAVDDAGKIINPMLAAGQRHGGIAQGISQALWEEAQYDEAGNLVTSTFVDYLLPAAPHLPSFHLDETETPTDTNPLGAKGIGELGTIGSTAAVLNACVDALSPLGVTDLQIPLRPEQLWRAMNA